MAEKSEETAATVAGAGGGNIVVPDTTPAEQPYKAPEGGYGWVIVGSVFTLSGFTWGLSASFGVYLSYYLSQSLFPGATPTDFAFVGGLNFAGALLISPLITILVRHFGFRPVMCTGIIFQCGGYIAASFANQVWHLYLTQGLLLGMGIGFTYVPSLPIVSQWFDKKRALVNGIMGAGAGIGGLAFSFATDAMIRHLSLGWSLRITGIVASSCNLVATMLLRDRNAHIRPPQRGFDTKLLFRYDVFLVIAWGFIGLLGYMTILYSLSDFGLSIGLSKSRASAITAFLNLGTAVGRPLTGLVGDRFGRIEVAGFATLLTGLGCFAFWIPCNNYGFLVFYAIYSGLIVGVFWIAIGPICVEVAGLAELQSMLSLTWLATVPPVTFAEVIALKLRRTNSSRQYLYTQIFAGISYLVAAVCIFELLRVTRRKKRRAVEEADSS